MSDPQTTVLMLLGQATVLLAAGLGASLCFRARPAAAHAVLVVALLAVLTLPAATFLAARAGWGLLPPRTQLAPALVEAPPPRPQTPIAATPHADPRPTNPPTFPGDEVDLATHAPAIPAAASTSVPIQTAGAWTPSRTSLVIAALVAWGVLSLFVMARLIAGIIAGVRLRRSSRPAEHAVASGALRRAAQDLGVADPVLLRTGPGVVCPVISCWGRPRLIILPEAPADVDWRAVMAHELAHLRRRDHLTSLLAELVLCILPWHPLAWLARRRLAALAERACDDWALRSAASSTSYADSLVAFIPARRTALLTPAIVSRSGLAARIVRILSDHRAPTRVSRGVAIAASLLALSSVAIAALSRPRAALPAQPEPAKPAPAPPEPAAKNEPGKSRSTPADVDAQIAAFLDYWRQNVDKPHRQRLSDLAAALGQTRDPRVIPPMIGVIDAGESDAIYDVGYSGLAGITGVTYSMHHDGAWWRRWWDANKAKHPSAAHIPIPDLPKTQAGKTHVAYPASLDTFEGKIEWFLKRFRDGAYGDVKYRSAAMELADLKDPRAIPAMIGVIDADNAKTISNVGPALSRLAGVKYSPYHDGAWWRRWWEANKAKHPAAAQVPIPDLPKTQAGRAYTPYPESLDTLDGKIEWLFKELRDKKPPGLKLSHMAQQIADHNDPRSIPPMIGVIAADNSYDTIYGVGYFGLGQITGVKYSPYHDGAWWRRWWDANKAKFPTAADIPIPDLPKTPTGLVHKDFPASLDAFDGKIEWLLELFRHGDISNMKLSAIAEELGELKDPRAIPTMIGVIDADNSYDTVYALSRGLRDLTGVSYSPYHDGAWWRRWWEANKAKYPAAADIPIPKLPPTAHAKTYTPMPASFDTFEGKLAWLPEALRSGANFKLRDYIEAIVDHNDARAIPTLIALMEADPSEETIYDAGYFGLCEICKVRWDSQDAAWWRKWWEENKKHYPTAADTPIPDFKQLMAAWKGDEAKREQADVDAQFAGFPAKTLRAEGDERKRYFLLGPAENQKAPADGWRLLLILPGGDGSADFHQFCRTIARDALPEGFVAAQLVAPVWSDNPNRTVWPTRMLNNDKAEFTTEDFIRAVVKDVGKQVKIDTGHVLALGWSSSGPPLYCDSLQADTPITGWFIAMSVFRPQWMPDLAAAKGKSYFLFHSPDEKMIPIDKHAKVAETKLREAGARVKLVEYPGGHGWTDDPIGNIRKGIEWLESKEP